LKEEKKEDDLVKDIKDTFKLLISKRMLMVQPLILYTGISMVIYSGTFLIIMDRAM